MCSISLRAVGIAHHIPACCCSDKSVRPPTGVTYVHWGQVGEVPEPNNGTGFEVCGMANASMSYQDAWGWADVPCGLRAVFICKLSGQWRWSML